MINDKIKIIIILIINSIVFFFIGYLYANKINGKKKAIKNYVVEVNKGISWNGFPYDTNYYLKNLLNSILKDYTFSTDSAREYYFNLYANKDFRYDLMNIGRKGKICLLKRDGYYWECITYPINNDSSIRAKYNFDHFYLLTTDSIYLLKPELINIVMDTICK